MSDFEPSANSSLRSDIQPAAWAYFNTRYALNEPFIWQEAQARLYSRLDVFTVQPQSILDAAARAGTGTLALARRYAKAKVIGQCATIAAATALHQQHTGGMLNQFWHLLRAQAEARVTWIAENKQHEQAVQHEQYEQYEQHEQYNLIVCNLALTWAINPAQQLQQWAKQLAPGGVLLFSVLGPDTAYGLRVAAEQAGWTTPIAPAFVDMHDYGDMMVQAGLTTPVMDVERLQLTYPNAQRLRQDSAGLMGNLHPERLTGLVSRARFKRLEAILNAQSPLTLDLELVFGHAWKPLQNKQTVAKGEINTVSLDSLKATLPSKKKR